MTRLSMLICMFTPCFLQAVGAAAEEPEDDLFADPNALLSKMEAQPRADPPIAGLPGSGTAATGPGNTQAASTGEFLIHTALNRFRWLHSLESVWLMTCQVRAG